MPHFKQTEEELGITYDMWLYVLKYLPNLTERPKRVFEKLVEAAEIAKFTPEEKEQYEESLKSNRDLKNVIETAFVEGKIKGKIEKKSSYFINAFERSKLPLAEIAEDFDVSMGF